MDPVTAAILVSMVVSTVSSVKASNDQRDEASRLRNEQAALQQDAARKEVSMSQQKTRTTLAGAENKRPMAPSFASAALTTNQSSNTSGIDSSGTF